MNIDKLKAMAAAIEEHFTTWHKETLVMKYANYSIIPPMAYSPLRLQIVTDFLTLCNRGPEFRDELGNYDPGNLDVMKYLFSLDEWGYTSEEFEQGIVRIHEQGMSIRLETLLPSIERKKEMAEAAINFLATAHSIYDGVLRIEKNRTNYAPEHEAKVLSQAERHGVYKAVEFMNLHNDPQVIAAQGEVLQRLAALSEQYCGVLAKAEEGKIPRPFMRVGDDGVSTGYRLNSGKALPNTFDNFMNVSGLGRDTKDLIMEKAPAGKYLTSLLQTAFNQSLNDEQVTEAMETYQGEKNFVESKQLAEYQPKGHVQEQDFNKSLVAAKTGVLATVEKMSEFLTTFEQGITLQVAEERSWRAKLEGTSTESGQHRGGKSTPPAARQGGWAENS